MRTPNLALGLCTLAFITACGGSDDGDSSLVLSWTFESGDCASNGVETVHVTWGPSGGAQQEADFACSAGSGNLGSVGNGSYQIDAEGRNASGAAVVESFGGSASFSGGAPPGGHTMDITLHPKRADLVVSWSLASGGTCPPGVILPFFITLYDAPGGAGASPAMPAVQESCSSGSATLTDVPPGDYVVEVDSRAVTPAVQGTAPVTVEAGKDAAVTVEL